MLYSLCIDTKHMGGYRRCTLKNTWGLKHCEKQFQCACDKSKTLERVRWITPTFPRTASYAKCLTMPTTSIFQYSLFVNNKRTYHNSWVTDIEITKDNMIDLVKGGRARSGYRNPSRMSARIAGNFLSWLTEWRHFMYLRETTL